MDNKAIKETLEKQLQLLSERSEVGYPGDNIECRAEASIRQAAQ